MVDISFSLKWDFHKLLKRCVNVFIRQHVACPFDDKKVNSDFDFSKSLKTFGPVGI